MEDLCSSIEYELMNIMSNCSCDVFNAFKTLCKDVGINSDVIKISYGDLDIKIKFTK